MDKSGRIVRKYEFGSGVPEASINTGGLAIDIYILQVFDGKQWENKFGREYGISGIPTMWLVDKKGNLCDMNARGKLEEKVEKLLAE